MVRLDFLTRGNLGIYNPRSVLSMLKRGKPAKDAGAEEVIDCKFHDKPQCVGMDEKYPPS